MADLVLIVVIVGAGIPIALLQLQSVYVLLREAREEFAQAPEALRRRRRRHLARSAIGFLIAMVLVAVGFVIGRHYWGVKTAVGVATGVWLLEVLVWFPWALVKDARRPVTDQWGRPVTQTATRDDL